MVVLMKVPKPIYMEVNPAPNVNKLMDDFFLNAKEYIQTKLMECDDNLFEVKSADLVYGSYSAYGSEKVNSDNRITYVEFKEKYIVAGMLETRTRFNDLSFTFFRDLSCLVRDVSGVKFTSQ
jgi:hypothetical protein